MDTQALEVLLRSLGVDYSALTSLDRRVSRRDAVALQAAEQLIDLAMGLHPNLAAFDTTVRDVRTNGPRKTP